MKELGIKPKKLHDGDTRPEWSVSVITDCYMSTGATPEERKDKFLKMLRWHPQLHFPMEGTDGMKHHSPWVTWGSPGYPGDAQGNLRQHRATRALH